MCKWFLTASKNTDVNKMEHDIEHEKLYEETTKGKLEDIRISSEAYT